MIEKYEDISTDVPYEDIDKEIRELVRVLNTLEGIKTTSCCCGHGEYPCMIWLAIKDIKSLNDFCFNYLNPFYGWQVIVETNIHRNQDYIKCRLQSKSVDIDKVVFEANELVNKIKREKKFTFRFDNDKPITCYSNDKMNISNFDLIIKETNDLKHYKDAKKMVDDWRKLHKDDD